MKTHVENKSVVIKQKYAYNKMSEAYRTFSRLEKHGANKQAAIHYGEYTAWRAIYIACGGNYNAIDSMVDAWDYKKEKQEFNEISKA